METIESIVVDFYRGLTLTSTLRDSNPAKNERIIAFKII